MGCGDLRLGLLFASRSLLDIGFGFVTQGLGLVERGLGGIALLQELFLSLKVGLFFREFSLRAVGVGLGRSYLALGRVEIGLVGRLFDAV